MAGESEKTFFDYAAVWAPILFAGGSFVVSWIAYNKAGQSSKEIFINSLRDKIKNAKITILEFDQRTYSQNDKIVITEKIRDMLLYQGYKKEKESFLDKGIQDELFSLQGNIEDYVSLVLSGYDIEMHKGSAQADLNSFLSRI